MKWNKLVKMKQMPRHPKRTAKKSTSLALTLRNTTRMLRLRQKLSRRTRRPREIIQLQLNAIPAETETPPDQ
jgi:hypothetical protein